MVQQVSSIQKLFFEEEAISLLQEMKVLPEYKILTNGYKGFLAKKKNGQFRFFKDKEAIEKVYRERITQEFCQVEAQ